jgi:hypothetical protein
MTKDWTTIRVRRDAKDLAERAKRDDETWSEYVRRCSDNPPEVRRLVDVDEFDATVRGADRGDVETVARQADG